jgi:hypothetical protein
MSNALSHLCIQEHVATNDKYKTVKSNTWQPVLIVIGEEVRNFYEHILIMQEVLSKFSLPTCEFEIKAEAPSGFYCLIEIS